MIETDLLIVGGGPAGASLAAFLSRYGLDGMLISAAYGTAKTPRAHLTSMSSLEAMRDIGLEDECYRLGYHGDYIKHYRWCEDMAGEEYARIYSWGNDPKRKSDYETASPCRGYIDLPQTHLEPLLLGFATSHGFAIRFHSQLVSFYQDQSSSKIVSVVKDLMGGHEYRIISKYLFGADGGRSIVVSQLGLPLKVASGGGAAWNVFLRCEIGHLMPNRMGSLHWNLRLKRQDPWIINMRMVQPWFEWMLIAVPKDPLLKIEPWTEEQWKDVVRDIVQDKSAEIQILDISKWNINETWAERYSQGNVFALGDAVHRHPPANALGSNTCIGDAFNLAWKINLVLKGAASSSLLESYNAERQPIGEKVVQISNAHLRRHLDIWHVLGMQVGAGGAPDREYTGLEVLKQQSRSGTVARKRLQELIEYTSHETHALGLEMGQKYSSHAIYGADEPASWLPFGKEAEDPILYYEACSYPGRKLPHVWLGQETPCKLVSTRDLAGKGKFCLFTGPGGQNWQRATVVVGEKLSLPIECVAIGFGQKWMDIYYEWVHKRGIEEDGALLVRPDLFCAWRAPRCYEEVEHCVAKLEEVLNVVLGWKAGERGD